jgi:hypothetical protein
MVTAPSILHLIRRADDRLAFDAAGRCGTAGTVLLIQEGVRALVPGGVGTVYASADDARAHGVTPPCPVLTDAQMAQLIVEHDRIMVW